MHHLELGGSIIESSNLQSVSFHFQSRWVTDGKVFYNRQFMLKCNSGFAVINQTDVFC